MDPGAFPLDGGIALVVGPYLLLGRALMAGKHFQKRTYRFAD